MKQNVKFNPKLQPGEERVKQEGQPGSKTITTPITVNPLTGEKVGEGSTNRRDHKTTSR
ncbi:G5 domain-containing protein [Staphylococcus aureus]|nr:G5 domain-containing protein [Staphylococcus aureus]